MDGVAENVMNREGMVPVAESNGADDEIGLSALARAALERAGGNYASALAQLESSLDQRLLKAAARIGLRSVLSRICIASSRAVLDGEEGESAPQERPSASRRMLLKRGFLDCYYIGEIALGDATAEDLREHISQLEGYAAQHTRRANFERRVLKRLGKGKKVRDCVSEAEVKKIAAGFGLPVAA